MVEFAYNNSYQASIGMTPFEALYGRPRKSPSCWIESMDRLFLGPVMIRKTSERVDLIQRRIKTPQDRQKSYADKRRTDLEFGVGYLVFIKVPPLRKVVRFGSNGKLSHRFIEPFPIIERVGKMAYQVKLPKRLARVHDVFHDSHLTKCLHESVEVMEPNQLEEVEIEREASVRCIPLKIIG